MRQPLLLKNKTATETIKHSNMVLTSSYSDDGSVCGCEHVRPAWKRKWWEWDNNVNGQTGYRTFK